MSTDTLELVELNSGKTAVFKQDEFLGFVEPAATLAAPTPAARPARRSRMPAYQRDAALARARQLRATLSVAQIARKLKLPYNTVWKWNREGALGKGK